MSLSDTWNDDEITLKWKRIFVDVLNEGPSFSLMVEPDEYVMDLRNDINELEGLPYDSIALWMGDTMLQYWKRLSDYNITDGTVVTLKILDTLSRARVELFVLTLDGLELNVTTKLDTSIASFKEKITKLTGIQQLEQRLLLDGRELKDYRKLVHYDMVTNTKLNFGLPLADCNRLVAIIVKTLSSVRFEVVVNLADTVTDLKEKIQERACVPVGVQILGIDRVIAGEEHLCDLGLEAGSSVYMYLYSSHIQSLDQVARLRELILDSKRAPISRETQDGFVDSGRSLYKDPRNWIVNHNSRRGWDLKLFDPAALWKPNPDNDWLINDYEQSLKDNPRLDSIESKHLEAKLIRARLKLGLAIRPYRVAANLTKWSNRSRIIPGVDLSCEFKSRHSVPLGADISNWAPDAFSDLDVMRLFGVSERMRQILASSAQMTECTLGTSSRKRINRAILFTYISILAGLSPSVEYNQATHAGECGICRDELAVQPVVMLACEHLFHAKCILPWASDSIQQESAPSCPHCRQQFLLSYDTLGKAELIKLEMLVNQN